MQNIHVGRTVTASLYISGNKKTGLEIDLASKEKKCAMVLVVNVTQEPTKKYDLTYDKCVKEGKNLAVFIFFKN